MQIENHFPFVVVVSTYDVNDFVYWVPFQTRSISPGTTGVVRAHDGGKCKIKLEMIDGPRTWVLDRPDDHVYSEHDVIAIGKPPSVHPAPSAPAAPVAQVGQVGQVGHVQPEVVAMVCRSVRDDLRTAAWTVTASRSSS
jgi:hypothetical protein